MSINRTTRARWTIRLSLAALAISLLGIMFTLPRSTTLSPKEAEAHYNQVLEQWSDGITKGKLETLFGPPTATGGQPGLTWMHWRFSRETLTESVTVFIDADVNASLKVTSSRCIREEAKGWDAWKQYWANWSSRLGL